MLGTFNWCLWNLSMPVSRGLEAFLCKASKSALSGCGIGFMLFCVKPRNRHVSGHGIAGLIVFSWDRGLPRPLQLQGLYNALLQERRRRNAEPLQDTRSKLPAMPTGTAKPPLMRKGLAGIGAYVSGFCLKP